VGDESKPPENVIDIQSKAQHYVAFAMCLPCARRWIASVTALNSLFHLECPSCRAQDSFASLVPQEYLNEFEE
jgi:hypothetical protein